RLIQAQADYAEKGVQLLAINANNAVTHPGDNFDAMKQRAQEQGFNFPYLRDESQEVAHAYGAERTPEIFLFDQSGKLQYHGAPDDNYEDPDAVQQTYFRDALDAVLAGETPALAQTAPQGCTIKWK
ncbi:MAG: thioredoxin family protein, partial [Anaerolineae bacterium]|nr:thioredoxin family protein [Anaerolineae bacterium]